MLGCLACLPMYRWPSIGIVIIVSVCHSCRDLVHRQTACWAVKHMALGVYGFGCDDALMHLFNLVWPNIFENSPHMVQAFTDAVDGCRVALGPTIVFQYTLQVCFQWLLVQFLVFTLLQGLFHPARKVREVYWKIYNMLYIGSQVSWLLK